MGTLDGGYIGTELVDCKKAELASKRNIVIFAEGYKKDQQKDFENDAKNVVDNIFSVEPFAEHRDRFCVVLVKVWSKDSGADEPSLVNKKTYFDAAFDKDQIRLLGINESLVVDLLPIALPPGTHVHKAVVLVNSPLGGGGGGHGNGIFVTSRANKSSQAAHEMGHTFGLSDEYDNAPLGGKHNITLDPAVLPPFWSKRLMPKLPPPPNVLNQDPGTDSDRKSVVALFETVPGRYRPQWECLMRTGDGFCKVCTDAIASQL